MQTNSKLYSLINYWSKQRFLRLNKALLDVDIKKFEADHDVLIPSDYANYLKLANGFDLTNDSKVSTYQDDEGFEFYPLDQTHFVGQKYLVFCCWTLGLVKYVLCVDKSPSNGIVVRLTNESEGYLLAENFSQFINLYLDDHSQLYNSGLVQTNILVK